MHNRAVGVKVVEMHARVCAKCSQSEPFLPQDASNSNDSPSNSVLDEASAPPTYYFPDSRPSKLFSLKRWRCVSPCLALCFVTFFLATIGVLVAWAILSDGFRHVDTRRSSSPVPRRIQAGSRKASYKASEGFGVEETSKSDGRTVCTSKACVVTASEMLRNQDKSVSPCEDFYAHACGAYKEHRSLSEDRRRVNVLSDMSTQLKRQLKVLLESEIGRDEKRSARAAKTFYQSCMDEDAVEKLGLAPLKDFAALFGDWPVLMGPGEWKEDGFVWEKMSGKLRRLAGVEAIVSLFVYVDMENSTHRLLSLDQPILGLQSRDYYVEGRQSVVMKAYQRYLVDTASFFGAPPAQAEKDMADVLDFEIAIANISLSEVERKDHSSLYNPMFYSDLHKKLPGIDWSSFLKQATKNTGIEVDRFEKLNIIGLPYLKRLSSILERTDKRTLANYLIWNLISSYTTYVSKSFRGPYQKFRKVYSGVTQDTPRWTECVGMTRGFMSWPLSAMYVDKHFEPESKAEMELLVHNLREVMRHNLEQVSWMDGGTRSSALLKLRHMGQKIGYPDYVRNETKVMADYEGVVFSKASYFGNVIRVTASKIAKSIAKVRKPVDDKEWDATPAVVNAFYSFSKNEIVFPAGILQFPIFAIGAPRYVNYPRIGMVIGHEITHGYDDQGRQYNYEGNVKNWWNPQTLQSFAKKSKCFAKQYGDIKEPATGEKLNGNLTLGENIADNGGLKIASQAYQLWRAGQDESEPGLPGFPDHTPDQMFYLSFANGWCEIVRSAAVRFYLTMDPHALARFRVNVPLRNSRHFAQAFQCPQHSPMNPENKCEIW